MDPALQIFFSIFPALSAVIGIIFVIRKGGSKEGVAQTTLTAMDKKLDVMVGDMGEVKDKVTRIEIQNATRDAVMQRDRECIQEIKSKVENHADRIPKIEGAVETIQAGMKITPKRTKGDSL